MGREVENWGSRIVKAGSLNNKDIYATECVRFKKSGFHYPALTLPSPYTADLVARTLFRD